jgi:transcriptional regulator with XRE-family HTH domain
MNQDQSKKLGALLRQKRQNMGYSMTQLAKAAGVRDSTVLRIERGEFAAPRPDKLARFAALLEIELADLYAKAGYLVPDELPSFDPYLSAKYPDLPSDVRIDLARHFSQLMSDHGLSLVRPNPTEEPSGESAGIVQR